MTGKTAFYGYHRHLESGHSIWNARSNFMQNAVKLFSQKSTLLKVYSLHHFIANLSQILLKTICLFLLVALYKLQQTKTSTQLSAIPYILYWNLPYGRLSLLKNLTKSGVSVGNWLLTLSIPKTFICNILINSYRCHFFRPSRGVRGHAPPQNFENIVFRIG